MVKAAILKNEMKYEMKYKTFEQMQNEDDVIIERVEEGTNKLKFFSSPS